MRKIHTHLVLISGGFIKSLILLFLLIGSQAFAQNNSDDNEDNSIEDTCYVACSYQDTLNTIKDSTDLNSEGFDLAPLKTMATYVKSVRDNSGKRAIVCNKCESRDREDNINTDTKPFSIDEIVTGYDANKDKVAVLIKKLESDEDEDEALSKEVDKSVVSEQSARSVFSNCRQVLLEPVKYKKDLPGKPNLEMVECGICPKDSAYRDNIKSKLLKTYEIQMGKSIKNSFIHYQFLNVEKWDDNKVRSCTYNSFVNPTVKFIAKPKSKKQNTKAQTAKGSK